MRRQNALSAVLAGAVTGVVASLRHLRGVTDAQRREGDPARAVDDEPAGDEGLFREIPAWKRWERDCPPRLKRLEWALRGVDREPVPSYRYLLEKPDPARKTTGICCSGGGIRSAAFNLGALQELQSAKRLQKARYLSAVSGGSYIAAAFAMVAKTHPEHDPESDDSDAAVVNDDHPPFYRNSPEEQHLRNNSSYMAPAGMGKVRLVQRVALGLMVNLAFLASGLFLAAWPLALYYRETQEALTRGETNADVHVLALWAAGLIAAAALTAGVISLFPRSRYDRWRQALERLSLIGLAAAAAVLVVAVALPELIAFLRDHGVGRSQSETAASGEKFAGGFGGAFGGLLAAVVLELRSKLSVEDAKRTIGRVGKLSGRTRRALAQVAAWVIGPLLLLSVFVLALLMFVSAQHISPWVIAGLVILFLLFWFAGDVTSWSLHPFYKRRLCTAFALKRVADAEGDPVGRAVERDYRNLVPLSKSGVEPGSGRPIKTWPTLIVCAAANVSDPGATPPGRSVTSFTFSPIAMGGPLIGGVPTACFEELIGKNRQKDFTLAAAVAMSGAAISPSMGKETRRAFRFLLTLGNVRLGVWVPNPRRVERWVKARERPRLRRRYERALRQGATPPVRCSSDNKRPGKRFGPRPGPKYLIKEMLGRNSVNDSFLYVTDGGHYENLGLVELLRRGCTEIFCFDASGGTSLAALGDAIALARSELDVDIKIDPSELAENRQRIAKKACAKGEIVYPDGTHGVLIYARSVVTESAPYDVQAFRLKDHAFPHHSTADQLYTDQKFEAYRELGAHVGRAALAVAAEPDRPALTRNGAAPRAQGPARALASRSR